MYLYKITIIAGITSLDSIVLFPRFYLTTAHVLKEGDIIPGGHVSETSFLSVFKIVLRWQMGCC